MTNTYGDVDASTDPLRAVEWQDRVDGWPQVKAYKRRVLDLLAEATDVLDVGCGPGADILAVGANRCVGVDRSMAMCLAAAARGAHVSQADVHQLPFSDGMFAGSFADRVLQHVVEPDQALAEMVRVLRPGGRLVIADPDQETLTIRVPGVRQELVDRIKSLRRDVGYRNGRLVSLLPAALSSIGMRDVSVEPFPLLLTDPDDAFGLPSWPHGAWGIEARFTKDDLAEWDEGVALARQGGFVYALTFFVVSGVRP